MILNRNFEYKIKPISSGLIFGINVIFGALYLLVFFALEQMGICLQIMKRTSKF